MTDRCQQDWEKMLNSEKQPKAIAHDKDDCSGAKKELKDKYYSESDLDKIDMENDIDVLILPPNYRSQVCDSNKLKDCHTGWLDGGIQYLSNTDVGENDVSSLKIVKTRSWDDHLVNCCTKNEDINMCGQWYGNTTGACDKIMQQYCAEANNQNKEECACLNATDESGNPVPQPQCFYPPCSSSPTAYQISNWKNIPCGSYYDCKQLIDIGGSTNSVIDSVQFEQHCGSHTSTDTVNTGQPSNQSPNNTSGGTGFQLPDISNLIPSLPTDYTVQGLLNWFKEYWITLGGGIVSILCIFCIFIIILLILVI